MSEKKKEVYFPKYSKKELRQMSGMAYYDKFVKKSEHKPK